MITRRAFGKSCLGALAISDAIFDQVTFASAQSNPAVAAGRAGNVSYINGVQFGLQPFCYHDLPMNPINLPILIERMKQNQLAVVEIWARWVEPHFEEPGASPEVARQKLREWRLSAPPEYYRKIKRQFDDAGIQIWAYWVNFDDETTDDEIETSYIAAKNMGCQGVTGSYGLAFAHRLVKYPEKYGLFAGLHNHDNLSDPDALSNEASFVKGFAISPDFKATLDVRHFTAGNGDCLSFLEKYHDRTSSVHLGDRRRNNGRSTPFGEGDAPIIEVIRMIRDNHWPILVLLEFEHGTLRTGVEEVQIAYDYCKRAVAS